LLNPNIQAYKTKYCFTGPYIPGKTINSKTVDVLTVRAVDPQFAEAVK